MNKQTKVQTMLSADEIIDVGGFIGGQIKKCVDNYCFDPVYMDVDRYVNNMKKRDVTFWGWIGEQPGKWLESVSAAKWYVKRNAEKQAKVNEIVKALSEAQEEEGYLGVGAKEIVEESECRRPIRGMDAYEMYSTLNGLMEMYENCAGDSEETKKIALATAVKLADYLVARIGNENELVEGHEAENLHKYEFHSFQGDEEWTKKTIAGHSVHEGWEGSLLVDPMMRLYELTGDTKYIDWVMWVFEKLDSWSVNHTGFSNLDKVYKGEMGINEIQGYVHAHTFQMNFIGMLRMYYETGDKSYLDKVVGAYRDITRRQRFITGTVSVAEHYEAGDNLPNSGNVGETCASNSWSRMCYELLCLTGESEYADAFERLLYNHFLATQTIDGDGYSYHRELNGSTAHYFTATLNGPDCCSSSGMRMMNLGPYFFYGKSENDTRKVFVNQYVPGEVDVKFKDGTRLNLEQVTNYPEEEKIHFNIKNDTEGEVEISFRIPSWARGSVIALNGKNIVEVPAGDYYEIKRVWKKGDVVDITFPMAHTWVKGTGSNEGLWAIKKGPVVYCVDSIFMTDDEAGKLLGENMTVFDKLFIPEHKDGEKIDAVKLDSKEMSGRAPFGALTSFYKVDMKCEGTNEKVVISPFANVGYWYKGIRLDDYNSAKKYPYAVWLQGEKAE